ncbi:hypothetical protein ScPMuIL_011367 [Solemya velum]
MAFSTEADGYVRGEGCGVVILKRLKQAIRDNDKVWGVITTGCNQDGHMSTPITAPSGVQQTKLLQSVYQKFNINPADIQYIEAHGTGTPTGDPVEFNSLGQFFMEARRKSGVTGNIPIGSAKTNVGHGESAAGMTGLIKVLLMMEQAEIVPSLNFSKQTANPKLNIDKYCLEVTTCVNSWKEKVDGSRVACVNAFGFGGTNAHAIVKRSTLKTNQVDSECPLLFTFSAKDKDSLRKTLQNVRDNLASEKYSLDSISYTSTCRRDHFSQRFAVCSSSRDELTLKLENALQAKLGDLLSDVKTKQVAFIFNGVGTTWRGMCKDLMQVPVFQDTIQKIDEFLGNRTNWSIADKFESCDPSLVNDPFVAHICNFACQVGLATVWRSIGITPVAAVGISVGEVAAAYISGVFSLLDATNLIFERSTFAAQATGGGMCFVGNRKIDDIIHLCSLVDNRVTVAVEISPVAFTLSGDIDAIDEVKKLLRSDINHSEYLVKDLDVVCAYHSYHMEKSSQLLFKALHGFSGSQPSVNLYSTVTGAKAEGEDFTTAKYWQSNLRQPVKLHQALRCALVENDCDVLIEIGAKPTIQKHMKNIFFGDDTSKRCLQSMLQEKGHVTLLESACSLYMAGFDLTLENMYLPKSKNVSHLPKYEFRRVNTGHVPDIVKTKLVGIESNERVHRFMKPTGVQNQMKIMISREKTNFVYEHVVDGEKVMPGAVYGEVGLVLGAVFLGKQLSHCRVSVRFKQPLRLTLNRRMEMLASLENTDTKDSWDFGVRDKNNQILATGQIDEIIHRGASVVNIGNLRDRMVDFVSLVGSYTYGCEGVFEIQVEESVLAELRKTYLHPAILDAMLQASPVILYNKELKNAYHQKITIVPIGIFQLSLKGKPQREMLIASKVLKLTKNTLHAEVILTDTGGEVICKIEELQYRLFSGGSRSDDMIAGSLVYERIVEDQFHTSGDITHSKYVIIESGRGNKIVPKVREIVESSSRRIDSISVDTFYGEAGNNFELEVSKLHPKSTVLFFPPGLEIDDDTSGTAIFDCVKHDCLQSCLIFVSLLKNLVMHNLLLPVIVVTNNTRKLETVELVNFQSSSSRKDATIHSTNLANVIGSELWGIARCAIAEFYYKSIQLVDVDNGDISMLLNVLNMHSVDMPQLRIQNGTVYSLEIETKQVLLPRQTASDRNNTVTKTGFWWK